MQGKKKKNKAFTVKSHGGMFENKAKIDWVEGKNILNLLTKIQILGHYRKSIVTVIII